MQEARQRTQEREQRSFDVLASVNMMRFDLVVSGYVQPETRQRVLDEELTFIAEGINRSLHTRFNLREHNGELVYYDRGEWRPYVGTLMTGLVTAQREAAEDPRKTFQVERATRDLQIGYELQALKPGEKRSWCSSYPRKEEMLYGAEFIRDLGYQPARKMGFLYHATKNTDGSLSLDTQSVDNSDDEAFEAALFVTSYHETTDIHGMRAEYDKVLAVKNAGDYFAGRKLHQGKTQEDAWQAIQKHEDLISYFMNRIEDLASNTRLSRTDLERAKKQLTYGVWAALKERLDSGSLPASAGTHHGSVRPGIHMEVNSAFRRLSQRNEVLAGCGGSIKGFKDSFLDENPSEIFDDIFGDKTDGESWTWKKGICRIDNCPTKPGATDVGPCDVCRSCQHWFDKGRDPVKLYGGLKVAAKNSITVKKSEAHQVTIFKTRDKKDS